MTPPSRSFLAATRLVGLARRRKRSRWPGVDGQVERLALGRAQEVAVGSAETNRARRGLHEDDRRPGPRRFDAEQQIATGFRSRVREPFIRVRCIS